MALPQLFRFDPARRKERDPAESKTRALIQAAERESNEIVLHAATDVRKKVVDARRDLALVQMQIEATVPTLGASEGNQSSSGRLSRQKVVERISDVAKEALEDARREIDGLLADVNGHVVPPQPPVKQPEGKPAVSSRRLHTLRWRPVPVISVVTLIVGGVALLGFVIGRRPEAPKVVLPPPQSAAATPVHPASEPDTAVTPAPSSTPTGALEMPTRESATSGIAHPAPSTGASQVRPRSSPSDTPDTVTPAVQVELREASDRWTQSYFALGTAPAPALKLLDERQPHERATGVVRRDIARPRIDVFGDAAVVTTSVTEHPASGPLVVSLVSQLWTRKSGEWQLDDVRIISGSGAERAFRR